MELEKELIELARLRAKLEEAEKPFADLRDQVKVQETAIREHVGLTGEIGEAGGLRVAMTAGRVTYDGQRFYDVIKMLKESMIAIYRQLWGLSGGVSDEKIVEMSNTIEGMMSMMEREIQEGVRHGAPVVRIMAAKKEKVK